MHGTNNKNYTCEFEFLTAVLLKIQINIAD
jgi:hypothetical protein